MRLSLLELSSNTEQIYLALGSRFASLHEELDRGFAECKNLVSYYTGEQDEGRAGKDNFVADIMAQTEIAVASASQYFTGMQDADESLFEAIDMSTERLGSLEANIDEVREDSNQLRLISMNAVVSAIKAGKAGQAFTVIADELSKLASDNIDLTTDLVSRSRSVLGFLLEFRTYIESTRETQSRLLNDFKDQLGAGYEIFYSGVQELALALNRIFDEANAIRQPFADIMELIQLQDLIRQSIDHVILSLDETDKVANIGEQTSEDLDAVCLVEKICHLCVSVLNDVDANIDTSLLSFRRDLGLLRQILKSVEEQRDSSLSRFIGSNADQEGALDDAFGGSSLMLEDLLSGINTSMEKKDEIRSGGNRIAKDIRDLRGSFAMFEKIVFRLHAINFASKIELSKEDSLEISRGNIDQMTALTSKIDKDTTTALDTIDQSQARLKTTLTAFVSGHGTAKTEITQVRSDLQRCFDRLDAYKDSLVGTLESFSLFTDDFYGLMAQSESDVERLGDLRSVIANIITAIGEIEAQAATQKQAALARAGLNTWDIQDDKMKDLIDGFTMAAHKETAADLAGIEIERGSDAGELTLF